MLASAAGAAAFFKMRRFMDAGCTARVVGLQAWTICM